MNSDSPNPSFNPIDQIEKNCRKRFDIGTNGIKVIGMINNKLQLNSENEKSLKKQFDFNGIKIP